MILNKTVLEKIGLIFMQLTNYILFHFYFIMWNRALFDCEIKKKTS